MRVLGLLLLAAAMIVVVLGGFWVFLTLTIDQPYDEIWIGLNASLPEPLRAWSCGQVAERVGAGLAPYGCEGLWGA